LGLYNAEFGQPTGEVKEGIVVKERARAIDMILPILVLVGLAVIFFPITTYLGAIDGETYIHFQKQ